MLWAEDDGRTRGTGGSIFFWAESCRTGLGTRSVGMPDVWGVCCVNGLLGPRSNAGVKSEKEVNRGSCHTVRWANAQI
jgi:hypothetical protein